MARIVVIGNGMVGSRFAAELTDTDVASRHRIEVLGAEEYEPYNRVLLSDFVAGRTSATALVLPAAPHPGPGRTAAVVTRGVAAAAVDRSSKTVIDDRGASHPYDALVLATGARAQIPDIGGLGAHALPSGVFALRTLDDARGIVAAAMNCAAAVVVGGGVLGLEAATGLARRGLAVTVVHAMSSVMDRQLDGAAGAVAAAGLRAAGVGCELATDTESVLLGTDGRVAGLRLADGRVLPADLVVLSCGTVPETDLARRAGLPVDRGIVVGTDLASPADPCVYAIGDCAQPPEGGRGLIAQGWDQARRLAATLTGQAQSPAPADPTADVVRLKAAGLDVVAMGATGPLAGRDSGHRVLRLSDPAALRHVEVVVCGDRVVGAICIGSPAVAADLTVAYTRGTPVPADPAALLLKPAHTVSVGSTSPTNMPDRASVCRCNGVTKGDIKACWSAGARTPADIAARTRATTGCGGCTDAVTGLLDWLNSSDPDPSPPPVAASQLRPPGVEEGVTAAKPRLHGLETSRL